jgi:hypothetical protein
VNDPAQMHILHSEYETDNHLSDAFVTREVRNTSFFDARKGYEEGSCLIPVECMWK